MRPVRHVNLSKSLRRPAQALMLILVLLAAGCAPQPPSAVLVFAAASLTDAFGEIAAAFAEARPGTAVDLNFASSSQLAAQLVEGAPADVFASANAAQMGVVIADGRVAAETVVPFASNRLAIAVPQGNPAGIATLQDLARPGLLLVIAVPGVPIRQYVDEVIARLEPATAAAVYANVISEEDNVRQVLAKVALGEADAGIVYTSDITPDLAGRVTRIDLPDELNASASYPIAALRGAPSGDVAQDFVDFVLSPAGQAILARWGFGPPP